MSGPPVGTDLPVPLLRARRGRAIRTGVIAIVLLAGVALLFGTMLVAQLLGSRSWQAGDPASAGRYFTVNQRLNLVEPWIAPFNLGVAAQGQGRWLEAADHYQTADPIAPDYARCRILLNWSWALESAGDEAKRAGHLDQAIKHWRSATLVVSRAQDCDDGRQDEDPGRPSTSPTPTDAPPPPATPSAQATAPAQNEQQAPGSEENDPGDQGGQPGEPKPGSEQDQVEQTQKRIGQKVGKPSDGKPQDDAGDEGERSNRLNERNQQAVEQRQRMQDDERQSSSDSPVRSW